MSKAVREHVMPVVIAVGTVMLLLIATDLALTLIRT
jgi:hypothetical protein